MSENQTPAGPAIPTSRNPDEITPGSTPGAVEVPEDDAEPAFARMVPNAPAGGNPKTGEPAGTTSTDPGVHVPATVKIDHASDGVQDEPMRPAGSMPKFPAVADAAADKGGAGDAAEADGVPHVEQSPTSMLHIRPPQEEIDKRVAAREQAARTKPVLPRVIQVLLAVCYPVVLLVLALRLVTTNAFLWIEYHRPGFPGDTFGFSTGDRMSYGSYAVDYLLNLAPPRYLGDLVDTQGHPLFKPGEVSHMADVKSVIDLAFIVGTVLAIAMVIFCLYLRRRTVGGIRRSLFAGSIVTLALVLALGVLAVIGWTTFFTDLHELFFANGTWTFYVNDTLIRLFPEQFWMDAGLVVGVIILVVSTLTLAFTWPTKSRRTQVAKSRRPGRRAAATE
ncbi:TIGR01906 family membrane protein [Specibacter cremeus]|uniref:TIGR01906 family membrane protein n=1 Tax=Specibacter cremeus TaxID=1629051 RepID=UPI001F0C4B49|nr:TIGR01906 family membrane protein [Specibacter cremeus]